jgi:hypothetical protein
MSVEGVDDGVGYGLYGRSSLGGNGVYGRSDTPSRAGVYGENSRGIGVTGSSFGYIGVLGSSPLYEGVYGQSDSGVGVRGMSNTLFGVLGESYEGRNSIGVYGVSRSANGNGVAGYTFDGTGVNGASHSGIGVAGRSDTNVGVAGESFNGDGVVGGSHNGNGVHGYSSYIEGGNGVYGESLVGDGVRGRGSTGVSGIGGYAGVQGSSDRGYGLFGYSNRSHGLIAVSKTGYAAYFSGNVYVKGDVIKSGGSFKIDHPLDPGNKYLSHSFVESPDMKNVYDGVVALDDKGEAEIELPDWFGTLNGDLRYQLTAIGAPGPNLHIAEEISDSVINYSSSSSNNKDNNNSRFKIAGGTSGMKVSWQVTGIRKDPWANANRIRVEEDKPAKEQGYYIDPELYGQPEEKGIDRLLFPEEEKWQEQLIR